VEMASLATAQAVLWRLHGDGQRWRGIPGACPTIRLRSALRRSPITSDGHAGRRMRLSTVTVDLSCSAPLPFLSAGYRGGFRAMAANLPESYRCATRGTRSAGYSADRQRLCGDLARHARCLLRAGARKAADDAVHKAATEGDGQAWAEGRPKGPTGRHRAGDGEHARATVSLTG
jgi:hypothetical protein